VFENRVDFALIPDAMGDFPVVQGDILDADALESACRDHGATRIIHLAALMPTDSQEHLRHGFAVNALGAVNVFDCATRLGLERVVYASSKSAYGRIPEGPHSHPTYVPLKEDHPCDPLSAYDIGKYAPEIMANNFSSDVTSITSLRYGTIYAPGKIVRHGRMGLHSRVIENAMAGADVAIDFGGDQKDDVMYVVDVAEGTVQAALHEGDVSPVYNIASGTGVDLKEFCDTLFGVFPEVKYDVGDGLDYLGLGVNYYSVSDISLARTELGYEPRFDIARGIRHYVESMDRIGLKPTVT
jgi:UDP-glucose 4-epimerase